MKSLPQNPSLAFLKKEAKALLALHRQGDSACCDVIRQGDTAYKQKTDTEILATAFSINDAQRIVARAYGYTSWATLKHFIESLAAPVYQGVTDKPGYHQTIVDSYDQRSQTYDNSEWHRGLAIQTVNYCPPRPGDAVLDIATGTGTIAFYAAGLVGPHGMVTGIDISKGMLKKCAEKLQQFDLTNLRFQYADAENLGFPPNSFDRIYCSSAFFWMCHPLAALRHWFEHLKPNGQIGINTFPDNSFCWGDGARQSLRKFGIDFTCNQPTGNIDKVQQLMMLAGFSNIRIHEVKSGRYISVEDAKGPPLTLESYAPGQHPHPLANVSEEILQLVQKDYEAEVDKRITDQGVWHDMTMHYVYAQKL